MKLNLRQAAAVKMATLMGQDVSTNRMFVEDEVFTPNGNITLNVVYNGQQFNIIANSDHEGNITNVVANWGYL
jgi:hypothetical protein